MLQPSSRLLRIGALMIVFGAGKRAEDPQ